VSRPEARTCAVCGVVSETTSEHSVHVTLGQPELSRSHRRAHGTTAVRPVSCWRCAALLPAGERTCPSCGWEHPGFEADRGEPLYRQEYPDVADLDHRGRPLDTGQSS
jgi:hypothetical protein